MRKHIIVAITLSLSLLCFSGCVDSRTSDYPDDSVNTARRIEDIKQNARDQKDAVDDEADTLSARLDFEEGQIRERYKARRQAFVNASNIEATDRKAKIRDIEIQAKYDKDVIDAEVADRLKTSPPESHAEIRADAVSRKSEIDNGATGQLAPIISASERSEAKNIQRGLKIDRDESQEISALEQDRARNRNTTKAKKNKIDEWTNNEMDLVATDSSSPKRQASAVNGE